MYMYKWCTWAWSCLHLKKANKFELQCCCSSITKEEHRGNRSLKSFWNGYGPFSNKVLRLLWIIGHCIVGINLPHGPIIVISQSKSIIYGLLENIVSCACLIWWIWFQNEKVQSFVISQSKSIMFLYWPFLENIVSCAYRIWYGNLIAEWDGPINVISQSKEIVFLHSPLPENIVSCPYAKDKFHSELVYIGFSELEIV